jgi:hypothetical protein
VCGGLLCVAFHPLLVKAATTPQRHGLLDCVCKNKSGSFVCFTKKKAAALVFDSLGGPNEERE